MQTGACRCSCEFFTYKLAKCAPSLGFAQTWCKHIEQYVCGHLERRAEVEVYRDHDGIIKAVPTGYSFDFAPLVVDAGAGADSENSSYDVEHDASLVHLAACIEAEHNGQDFLFRT